MTKKTRGSSHDPSRTRMSETFLAAVRERCQPMTISAGLASREPQGPRPPKIKIFSSASDILDRRRALSNAKTNSAVARFLESPHRRSCAFVNPDDETLSQLHRTASTNLSLVLGRPPREHGGERFGRPPHEDVALVTVAVEQADVE